MAVTHGAAPTSEARYERLGLRVGAACAILGPILAIVVNIVHPRPSSSEVGKHEEFLRLAADSGGWTVIHIGLILAFVLFFAGLVALTYSLRDTAADGIARLALTAAIVSTTLSLVQATLDLAVGQVADEWADASGTRKDTLLRVGGALEDVDFLLLSVELILFFGVTFLLYGAAVSASRRYPAWWGWVAGLVAVASIVIGFAQAFHGRASIVTLVGLPIVAAVLSLWLLATGVTIWRRTAAAVP